MSKLLRGMGWMAILLICGFGAVGIFFLGLFTFPLGIIIWILGFMGICFLVVAYRMILQAISQAVSRNAQRRTEKLEATKKIKAMNPHIWDENGKLKKK